MIRNSTLAQIWKYGLVGMLNTAIGLGVIFFCMHFFQLNPFISNVVGYGIALINSYYMNKSWTFSSSCSIQSSFPRFLFIFAASYTLQILALYLLILCGVDAYQSQIYSMVLYIVIGFWGNKLYSFNQDSNNE